ncbi:hypothetical protein [Gimesia maris]|uniref:hypothetical protein n=1 Tax=Gimesia maris TaxID=122 RepID=UPI0030DB110B|tara:strand:+ start:20529 stop:21893 length:1365 start_codon:yes stop_codon:yes gene_type:complete
MTDTFSHQSLSSLSRREMLKLSAAAFAGTAGLNWQQQALHAAEENKRPTVAAIYTQCFYLSHAFHILHPFLGPYLFNGKLQQPQCDVVSFYGDQFTDRDLSRGIAKKYEIPFYQTIGDALTLGGDELAVDAVLSIGEHGDYPDTKFGQTRYPRKRFFDEIVAVMEKSKRFVPVFSDKHFSYRWDWAREMYDTSRKYEFPMMVGSSVPLAQRTIPLEIPSGTELEDAVSIHGGPIEKYDIHGLEVLQSMVEFRKGGETGISTVQFLKGDDLIKAGRQGRWSMKLAEAAMQAELGKKKRGLFDPIGAEGAAEPHGILLEYKDGFRATMLKIGANGVRWNFACQVKGEAQPKATTFFPGPWGNRNLFRAFSHAIQHLFVHKEEPYPCERTLLMTGALDAAMHSYFEKGQALMKTPELEFSYTPKNFNQFREMGDSWKVITAEMTPPQEFVGEDPAPQ